MTKLLEMDTIELINELTNRYDHCVIGLAKDNPAREDIIDKKELLFIHKGNWLKCMGLAEGVKYGIIVERGFIC